MLDAKTHLVVAVAASVFGAAAMAQDIIVPDDHATIQAAIDAANEGDVIAVRAGDYQEWIDFGAKNLVLESFDGAASTFIGSFSAPESIVKIIGGQTSATELRGFTIRSGYQGTPAPQNPSILIGGGLYILDSDPLIESCVFTDNKTAFGAGCYVLYGSPEFDSCTFFDNYSTSSGGGLQLFVCSAHVQGCVFDDNTAIYQGGGTKVILGDCTFDDCEFINNGAEEGGGVYWFSEDNPTAHTLSMSNCTITDNHRATSGFGGGIRARYGFTPVALSGTTVCDNTPDEIYGPIEDLGGNTLCICPADFNGDGEVNGSDLGILLAYWGPCLGKPCFPDINHDGVVDGADMGLLLASWGPCTKP